MAASPGRIFRVEQPNKSPVALVVGAGDFIGAAIAKRFAAGGFVTAVGRRNADKLAPLVAEIEASGGRARGFALDNLRVRRGGHDRVRPNYRRSDPPRCVAARLIRGPRRERTLEPDGRPQRRLPPQ